MFGTARRCVHKIELVISLVNVGDKIEAIKMSKEPFLRVSHVETNGNHYTQYQAVFTKAYKNIGILDITDNVSTADKIPRCAILQPETIRDRPEHQAKVQEFKNHHTHRYEDVLSDKTSWTT